MHVHLLRSRCSCRIRSSIHLTIYLSIHPSIHPVIHSLSVLLLHLQGVLRPAAPFVLHFCCRALFASLYPPITVPTLCIIPCFRRAFSDQLHLSVHSCCRAPFISLYPSTTEPTLCMIPCSSHAAAGRSPTSCTQLHPAWTV
jgi:hypothetical protein